MKSSYVIIVLVVIALAGGGFVLFQNQMKKQAEMASLKAAEADAALKVLEAERVEREKVVALEKEFEAFLNGFIQQVESSAKDYKTNRKVMSGLIDPINLTTPEYINENVKLARTTVVDLESQMSRILSIFGVADVQVQSLIGKFDEDAQKAVQASWDKTKGENSNLFMAYFASEQDILKGELALIEFYNANRVVLSIDENGDRVLFEDDVLQQKEALLRGRIMELQVAQKDLMKPQALKGDVRSEQEGNAVRQVPLSDGTKDVAPAIAPEAAVQQSEEIQQPADVE